MKKFLSVFLAVILTFSTVICGISTVSAEDAATTSITLLVNDSEVTDGKYTFAEGSAISWDEAVKQVGEESASFKTAKNAKTMTLNLSDTVSTSIGQKGSFWIYFEALTTVTDVFWEFSSSGTYTGACVRYYIKPGSIGQTLQAGWNKIEFEIHKDSQLGNTFDNYRFYLGGGMTGNVDWSNVNFIRFVVNSKEGESQTVRINGLTFGTGTSTDVEEDKDKVDGFYTYTVLDGKATIIDVDESISGDVVIPSTLGGFPVTAIGDKAFQYCKKLKSIVVPDFIESMGTYVFSDCYTLESFVLSEKITQIPEATFFSCYSLKEICLNENIVGIGDGAFAYCSNIKEITLPSSLKTIGFRTFYNTGINTITIPENVIEIDGFAFESCDDLTTINYNATNCLKVGYFNYPAFYTGTPVELTLNIGENVKSIPEYAFYRMLALKKINIPDSVIDIGNYAFYVDVWVTSVHLGSGIQSIGDYAFGSLPYATGVTFNGTEKDWESVVVGANNDCITSGTVLYLGDDAKFNEFEDIGNSVLTKGNVSTVNNGKLSSGSAIKLNNGAKVKFAVDGNYFELVSYKSPSQGKMYVKIDNGEEILIDLYADEYDNHMKSVVYRSDIFTDGTHTAEIRVEGKAYIDAINVVGDIVKCDEAICEVTTYEAENSAIELNGNWKAVETWSLSNHKALQATDGESATFTYTGYGFDIISYMSMTQGKMYISVDGSETVEIDLNRLVAYDMLYKELAYSTDLSYGTHTVEITTEGKVILDAIKIDGTLN